MKNMLMKMVEREYVNRTVFQLGGNKAPGPDGMCGETRYEQSI